MMSFKATGMPWSGPLWCPARISLSASDALSSARSPVTVTKEFVSSASIRPSNALTTSTGERRLARSSLERPVSERGRSAYRAKALLLRGRTCAVSHSVRECFRYYRRVIARARKTLRRFDRRVWLLLFAMLAFRFGHGLYFPFSSIYFHNVLGIPLSLVGVGGVSSNMASDAGRAPQASPGPRLVRPGRPGRHAGSPPGSPGPWP